MFPGGGNHAWVLLGIAALLTLVTILFTEVFHFEIPELTAKVLYGVATVLGVVYPAKSGWASLRQGRLTINALLVVAVAGAIYLNLWEEAAGLVVIFSLGDVLKRPKLRKAPLSGSVNALGKSTPP